MESKKVEVAGKILDYWFAMEFLGQDSYEMCTNAKDSQHKVKAYKKTLNSTGEGKRKQITTFLEAKEGQSLYEVIKKECEDCRMGTWGSITVYLGKIKRELCIENIAEYLAAKDTDRPEKNHEDIAIASFQIDANGNYMEHSFSLSPVVWSIRKLRNIAGGQLSDYLSGKEYQEDISGLEKKLCESLGNSDDVPTSDFSENAITMEKIVALYTKIKGQYIDELSIKESEKDEAVNEFYGISFQMFKDEQTKERYEEDNYLGLSHDYFSNDLKLFKDLLEDRNLNYDMYSDLIKYINAPHDENKNWERFDLINTKDADELELWLQEVLNMRNAPLGKWPSRYMPALMQQVAVNFATVEQNTGIFGKNGKVFSVNGPPGTGKTTLLKEIVASNIIEKARRLASYKDPDEAFEKHEFIHGKKSKHAYSKFIPYWHSLKDNCINDYSILVTSCNNAAVENITKELPLESGILGNLKTTNKDSDLVRAQLGEVENLFTVGKSNKTEVLYKQKHDKEGEYKEIYFSGYAQQLFDTIDAWGLVAVPLGKKSNIKSFYYNVLEPIRWDFYRTNQFKEERKDLYAEAREQFQAQLLIVEALQEELARLGDIAFGAKQAEETSKHDNIECLEKISLAKQNLSAISGQKETLQLELDYRKEDIKKVIEIERGFNDEYEACKNRCTQSKQLLIEAQEKALSATDQIGILTRLFNKKKCQDAENLAESYRRQAVELQDKVQFLEKQMGELEDKAQEKKHERGCRETELKKKDLEMQELLSYELKLDNQIQMSKNRMKESCERAQIMREDCEQSLKEFQIKGETHCGLVLDNQFVLDYLSEDEKASTTAQISNPWSTDHYNREREKLVYYALQLTKEFILNSKCCRDNFTILGQYWGLRTDEDNERVDFHKTDRERMAGALYQTLFLLVPVISSTFASVGSLLRDIKSPGVFGTLVVDEAGQAQPQMAVGALYRSRKAIIVGDPKQVEPVVTDDLELLKKSYKEEIYRYYQDKSLSVQKCADLLNPFGTYLPNSTDYPDWVGSPLLVHRRCIAPMYEIANKISYGGIMKQQTLMPGEEEQKSFIYEKTQWLNVSGYENGRKDHFVKQQGGKVCELLEVAFRKNKFPDIYIISPFKSVVYGIRKYIKDYCYQNRESFINKSSEKDSWLSENIGTVHTFQGKEANEVIFLLGCDGSKASEGAVQWVNSNIVNVAVTRAKYRLYVIGDIRVWDSNKFISEMKAIMDTYAILEIDILQKSDLDKEQKESGYKKAVKKLPSMASFPVEKIACEDGKVEYTVETGGFINSLDKMGFLNKTFTKEQLEVFGFEDEDDLNKLPSSVKKNVTLGMKLYYLLAPIYKIDDSMDVSCCAILFCKALEQQLKINFTEGVKKRFPDFLINAGKNIKLKEAKDHDLMIGTIQYILRNHVNDIGKIMQSIGEHSYNLMWWKAYNKKLEQCAKKRNQCCHSQFFGWKDIGELIQYEFKKDGSKDQNNPKIGGVLFESVVGKKL